MKTAGEKLGELVDELDYHLLWYKWFIKNPNVREKVKFDEMDKSQQVKFLKIEERKRRVK